MPARGGALGLGIDAFLGRDGEESWIRLGTAMDELWEDVLEELDDHLDWTGAGTVAVEDYPRGRGGRGAAAEPEDLDDAGRRDVDLVDDEEDPWRPAATGATAVAAAATRASAPSARQPADRQPGRRRRRQEFWEAVGILPVEVVVPEGAGLTLRCYVEDKARFLGRDGEVFVFPTPADLARFCAGNEAHDLAEIASWPEVADTDARRCPPTRTATTSSSSPRSWPRSPTAPAGWSSTGRCCSRRGRAATSPSTPTCRASRSSWPRTRRWAGCWPARRPSRAPRWPRRRPRRW